MTDWLVPVRAGENEELRYAIRTWVANGGLKATDTLFVVGDMPDWLTGVEFIKGNKAYDAARNVYGNIRLACEFLTGEVIVVNDDFFFTKRVDVRKVGYRSTLTEHIAKVSQHSPWGKSLRSTDKFLRHHGFTEPLSYELHRPIAVNAQHMAKTLRIAEKVTPTNPPQWRTLYGNLYGIAATQMPDGKLFRADDPPLSSVLSTTDHSWSVNTEALKIVDKFTKKSRYEK